AVAVHAPQLRRADGTVGIAGTSVDRGDLTVRGDAPDVAETGDVDGVVVGDRDVRGGGQDRVGGCTAVAVVVLGSDVALAVARDHGSLAVRADPIDAVLGPVGDVHDSDRAEDRKSTRLNSSHVKISYAVFCLKKKKTN